MQALENQPGATPQSTRTLTPRSRAGAGRAGGGRPARRPAPAHPVPLPLVLRGHLCGTEEAVRDR